MLVDVLICLYMSVEVLIYLHLLDGVDPYILTYVGGCPHVLLLYDDETGGQVSHHSTDEEDPVESYLSNWVGPPRW